MERSLAWLPRLRPLGGDLLCLLSILICAHVRVVCILLRHQPFDLSTDWLDTLQALAAQAAIAIDSAQLFLNLQHSSLELELAYQATIEGWARALDLHDKG